MEMRVSFLACCFIIYKIILKAAQRPDIKKKKNVTLLKVFLYQADTVTCKLAHATKPSSLKYNISSALDGNSALRS